MKQSIFAFLMLSAALWSQRPMPAVAAPGEIDAKSQLEALYEAEWQRWLREDPTLATVVGDPRYNDRWPDLSLPAIEKTRDMDRAALAALMKIDVNGLPASDRLNYDIAKVQFGRRLAGAPFKSYVYAVSHLGSLQSEGSVQTANEIAEISPFATAQDYENWIARLRGFGAYADQVTELLRIGIREKRTQPRLIMARIRPQLAAQRVANPEDSPFFAPFKRFPASLPAADVARLTAEGREAIADVVLPAFARFEKFFNGTYVPACRQSIGIADTPDGQAFYRELIEYHTTTTLTPDEIHATGLAEVKRIRGEMDKIIAAVNFKGDFQEFSHYLRTDPKFFYTDPNDLLHGYMVIAKGIDPNLVKLFGKLPRTPYGVRPVPETSAPNTTTAYYQPLSSDGSRPGFYYVNLFKPEARPKWEMEVLTSHEAVPGHHLQLALQYENSAGVPMIRRMSDFTAYVEGWALYAESLGPQVGLYTDPYQKFGQLTYDMWRAVRLVVDTGIHSRGWTRQQAIEFFTENAPKSELDIANEIDRYIAWPGQALAYKVGQLKIVELRDAAAGALGANFDIREFHDIVLSTGAVPLSVLDRTVRDWIADKTRH
ncbi:MAG TPA: DUF885 domain-containing protein [Steroidobacteraceae bacterium]|nr:DUF885 domain-containing protein [Steroidobacteraceae bacterium]